MKHVSVRAEVGWIAKTFISDENLDENQHVKRNSWPPISLTNMVNNQVQRRRLLDVWAKLYSGYNEIIQHHRFFMLRKFQLYEKIEISSQWSVNLALGCGKNQIWNGHVMFIAPRAAALPQSTLNKLASLKATLVALHSTLVTHWVSQSTELLA